MRIASIDIGTNTCNLCIAEYFESSGLRFLCKEKRVITLINPQFKDDLIPEGAIINLIEVLTYYKKVIDSFEVDKVIATATSGIRSSANRDSIVGYIQDIIDIDVNVIDGHTEAGYVYEGVKNAVEIGEKHVLVIDIGGGSVEFIICNKDGITATFTYNIGAARLLNKHKFSDPLSRDDLDILRTILNNELHSLIEKCIDLGIDTLIGSSGSFETFVDLINNEIKIREYDDSQTYNVLDIKKFDLICKKLVKFNYDERAGMPGMEITRIKMIPIAAVVTRFLIERLSIKKLIQSRYSIKEGLIFDYISKNFKDKTL